MNLFMWGILVFCNFIMALTLSLAAKPHNHVIIENTLPVDKLDDPQVVTLAKQYRKRQFQIAFFLSVIEAILLLPMKDYLFMLLFFLLLMLSIGCGYYLQIRYIRKMRRIIEENHWQLAIASVQINTKLVREKNEKMVSVMWFVLAGGLSLLLFYFAYATMGNLLLIATVLLIEFSLIGGWYLVSRLPVRALTNDQEINRQYNNLTKYYWSFLMVGMGIFFPPLIYFPLLSLNSWKNQFILLTAIEFAMLVFLVIFTVAWLLTLRRKQDALLDQSSDFRYQGDDYYWRYGVYYNPEDSRFMVPDRIGLNLSVNLAKTGAKITMALGGVVLLIALFISVVPLYILDNHPDPFTYTVNDKNVTLEGPFVSKRAIPLTKIQQVDLVEELPKRGLRTNGFATDHYAMGSFKLDGKAANLFIDHHSHPILLIQTAAKNYYYTNKSPAKTRKAYQEIKQELK
ncbi:PH domain-containing protein [Enterococcus sp. AZ163]|uniref:PH domain-containing protein n=1 Tax=Enterococcus sp. AZ163 TaxID=2774638 RepID=UPI003D2A206C